MYPIRGYDTLVIVCSEAKLFLGVSHYSVAMNLEACIHGHVDASIESFEISFPRHRVLLSAYALAAKLGSQLGIFGIVTLTHNSDHSCALEFSLEQSWSSVVVL